MSPHAAATSRNSTLILDTSRMVRYQFNFASYIYWKTKLASEKRANLRALIIKNMDDAALRAEQSSSGVYNYHTMLELMQEVYDDFESTPVEEAYKVYKWRSNECAKNNAHFMAIQFSL